MKRMGMILFVVSIVLSAPDAAHAARSYGNCTGFITSVPTVINSPGIWCFSQNLSTAMTTGSAIDIQSDNVTIDCNDFKLDGLSAGVGTQAYGIAADNRINATVKHCNVRGFQYGLRFQDTNFSRDGGHAVEDNRFDGNTCTGLEVAGDGSVIRRNRVFDTGGSTVIARAIGIAAEYSVDVLDNTVSGVIATSGGNGYAAGISTIGNDSSSINGNRIRGVVKDGSGVAAGVSNELSDRITFRGKDIVGDASGGSVGISCDSANGRAKDNAIKGFGTGIVGCSNDGNIIKP